MFNKRAKRPTVAERERMARLKEMPCIACQTWGKLTLCGPTEVHHLLSGNKRIGHGSTIPLGSWHHRAVCINGYNRGNMEYLWGPSLANGSKSFHAEFGTDTDLLARTNKLLEQYDATAHPL